MDNTRLRAVADTPDMIAGAEAPVIVSAGSIKRIGNYVIVHAEDYEHVKKAVREYVRTHDDETVNRLVTMREITMKWDDEKED